MILPHSTPQEIAPGLYTVDGTIRRMPLGRRMTIIDIGEGRLLVNSAIRLSESEQENLKRRGEVAVIIVPNDFHDIDARFYSERYPRAAVLVPPNRRDRFSKHFRVTGDWKADWPQGLSEVESISLQGVRSDEIVLFHRPSRSLIVTDLAFNIGQENKGILKWCLKIAGMWNHFGPSRLYRLAIIKDRSQLASSIREILKWDFDRIIVSHGAIVENGGREKFRQAFQFLGI